MDWYQVREDMVPGETHYKAILEASRVRARSYTAGLPSRGRPLQPVVPRGPERGWDVYELRQLFLPSTTTTRYPTR